MVVSGAAFAAVVLDETGSVVGRDMMEDRVGVGSRLVDVDVDDMKCVGELDELGGSVVVVVVDVEVDVDVDVDVLEVDVEVEIGIEVVF